MRLRYSPTLNRPNAIASLSRLASVTASPISGSLRTSSTRHDLNGTRKRAAVLHDNPTDGTTGNQNTYKNSSYPNNLTTHTDQSGSPEGDKRRESSQRPRVPLSWLSGPYSRPSEGIFSSMSKRQARKLANGMVAMKPSESDESDVLEATRPLLLTLDAFDTIFTPKVAVAAQYREVASLWGFELTEQDIEVSFRRAFKKLSKEYPNYGKDKNMDYQIWWHHIIRNTLEPLLPEPQRATGVPMDLIERLYLRFSSSEGYKLFHDVMQFLSVVGTSFQARRWAPRRTLLGVISNSDPRVRDILTSFGINIAPAMFPPRYTPLVPGDKHKFGPANFAFATLSYECGHSKPSRMIFDAATREAQVTLDRLHPVGRLTRSGLHKLDNIRHQFHHMHVGDEVEKDILPALSCGWDAVLLDRSEQQPVSTRQIGGQQITVINSLMALRTVVTKERFELEDGTSRQAPVWIDESKPIQRALHHRYADLKGRKVVRHPLAPENRQLDTIE